MTPPETLLPSSVDERGLFDARGQSVVAPNAKNRGTTNKEKGVFPLKNWNNSTPHLVCPKGQTPLKDATYFLQYIPEIMRNKKWCEGERLSTLWLQGTGHEMPDQVKEGLSDDPVPLEAIDVDWVWGFRRVQTVYRLMLTPGEFPNPTAQAKLKAYIQNRLSKEGVNSIAFGDVSKVGRELDGEYCDRERVLYSPVGEMDDSWAALGRFWLHLIAVGEATRTAGWVHVTISSVGMYARDSYDFNGWQPLGSWRRPDKVKRLPQGSSVQEGGPMFGRCSGDWFNVSNDTYRDYRARTGFGRDFLIYSNVKTQIMVQPVSFSFRASG